MKKNITSSLLMGLLLAAGVSHAQIRIANNATNFAILGSSAFIDASSNAVYNSSTNVGKGLLYPRTDLSTFTAFGGTPFGLPTSFPTYYDGFVVYNTKEGGIAGVGTTQGTLSAGFWYYENKSTTINGGIWKPFTTAGGATTNVLSSSGNNITSNINGISSTTSAVNSNALSLSGSSVASTVNGITSNLLNLAPAITASTNNILLLSGNNLTSTVNGVSSTADLAPLIASATTNTLVSGGTGNNTITSTVNGVAANTTAVKTVSNTSAGNNLSTTVNGVTSVAVPVINNNTLSLSGNNLTSTVNGVASSAVNLAPAITATTTNILSSSVNTMTTTVNGIARTAPIVNSVSNTISGNTLTTTVNGISSSPVTLPQGVNIYNSDGTLNSNRVVSTNNKMLWFQNNSNNHIAFDINVAVPGSTRIVTQGSSASLIRALANSSRTLDMELLTDGTSRLLSTGSTELFIGTNSSSGPLTFGVGTNRAVLATNGNFGIGTTSPSQKLHVTGNIRATGSIMSGTTTYPDYVFENYYKGSSNINPNYTFKKLNEVEEFIKEKGHLPGYASIDEVKKNDMTVDITQNSITNMEKVEELYLHLIEQSKQIEVLQKQVQELKNLLNKS